LEITNKLLADLLESNIWFSSNVTDAIKKKFQSMVHHQENVVKSAQKHMLAPGALPHDVLDRIISHIVHVATKKNLVPFAKFTTDLFQIEVSHLYMPATNEFTLILHIPMVSNANLLNLYEFCHCQSTSISLLTFRSCRMSVPQTFSRLATRNLFKLFPAPTYMPTSTSETLSFAKEGR
jgi:hypothetical protein